MSAETTKAVKRRKDTYLYNKVFTGKALDVGCGEDLLKKEDFPNLTSVEGFDLPKDANKIDEYFPADTFDVVHGSQVLEHLWNPLDALTRMLKITKPGGFVVMSFPDEDLYEKGMWPSRFNSDHKVSFSIYKPDSEMPKHNDVLSLLGTLCNFTGAKIIKVELVDTNYDYNKPWYDDQTRADAEAFIEIVIQKEIKTYTCG
jgi:SAM-dependent methyltransferase